MAFQSSATAAINAVADDALLTRILSFMRSAHPDHISALRRFVSSETAPVSQGRAIPPIEEMEIRLSYVRKIRDIVREDDKKFQFTAWQLSIFMTMPIHKLKEVNDNDKILRCFFTIGQVSRLTKEFIMGLLGDPEADEQSSTTESHSTTASKKMKPRCRSEARKCIARDNNACIFTGTAHPEACHIIPYSFNSSDAKVHRLQQWLFAMDLLAEGPWATLLCSKTGASDYSWNMLSINRQLHDWWARGLWAIKCLGIMPNPPTVCIQFHWMPKRSNLPRSRKINIDTADAGTLLSELLEHSPDMTLGDGGIVAAYDAKSGLPLISGQLFEVKMDSMEDAQKMKLMVDLQWSIIVVTTMAGAADSRDDRFFGPDSDGLVQEERLDRVVDWLDADSDDAEDDPKTPEEHPAC